MAKPKKVRSTATATPSEATGTAAGVRRPSRDMLVKELRGAIADLEASLLEIEKGRMVSQDVLNLEFAL